MLAKTIQELGSGAFDRKMDPLKRTSFCQSVIVGFDTEYDSKSGKLLSFQLATEDRATFTATDKLSVDKLARAILGLGVPPGSDVMLVTFFSLAELQFLPVKTESYHWREYGSGSLDCDFYSARYKLTLHVFDIARFFDKQPLSKVAESFGLKKLEWSRSTISKKDLHKEGFRDYAINDAKLCVEIVRRLREQFTEYGVDPIHEKTAASTAASVFRRGWVTQSLHSGNNRARLAGMRGCWGGRAEALRRGTFPNLLEYDLRSAYPQAAITLGVMPCQGSWKEYDSLSRFEKCLGGIAHVVFRFPADCLYPCLPHVQKDCQLYPLEGKEWVTLDEIRLARKMGASIRILEAWGYVRGTTILAAYMSEILEKRAKATGAQRYALKLLANSLIGKFAQRVCDIDIDALRVEAEKQKISVDDLGKLTREELRALGIKPNTRIGSVFMPEWNALITGHVRARISAAAAETDAVYIATDAIWTEKSWKKAPKDFELKRQGAGIVARTRLGMIEGPEGLEDASTHVAHHSIWNRKAALAALNQMRGLGLLLVPESDTIGGGDCLSPSTTRYRTRKPTKLRESLRTGRNVGEWVESFRTADTRWDFKRELMPDGTTKPWRNAIEYRDAISRDKEQRKASKKATGDNPTVPKRIRQRRIYLSIGEQIRRLNPGN